MASNSVNEYPCELPIELRTNSLTEIPSDKVNESAYDLRVESLIDSVGESLSDMPIDSPTELSSDLTSGLAGELPNADTSLTWRGVQRRFCSYDRRSSKRGLYGGDPRSDALSFETSDARSDDASS